MEKKKIEPLKDVVVGVERIEGTNTSFTHTRLPDNREMMEKINEIIELVNKLIER